MRLPAVLCLALIPLGGMQPSPPNLALIAFLLAAFVGYGYRLEIPIWPGKLPTLLWLALSALVLTALGPETAVSYLGAAMFFFSGAYLGRRKWEGAVLVSAVVAALVTLLHYFGALPPFSFEGLPEAASKLGPIHFRTSYIGLFGAREDYVIWAILGLLACARLKGKTRFILPTPIVAGLVVLQSRSGWIAVAVFLIVAVSTSPIVRTERTLRMAWISLLLIVGTGLALSDIPQEIEATLISVRPESAHYRSIAAATAIEEIRRHPLRGVGYDARFVVTGGTVDHLVHNTPLFYGALFGLPAMIVFCLLYGDLIFRAWRQREYLMLAAVIAVAVPLMLYSAFGSKAFWAFAGLAAGSLRHRVSSPVQSRNPVGEFTVASLHHI